MTAAGVPLGRVRTADGWMCRFGGRDPLTHLVCAPPAGTGTTFFNPWPALLPERVAVHAVHLPGREERFGDPLLSDAGEAAERLVPHVVALAEQRPVVLFGHSLGGLLMVELARRMRLAGVPPVHVVVAACLPSDVPAPRMRIAHLPDDEFIACLVRLGGLPAELGAAPKMLAPFLPTLRADMAMAEGYYPPPAALDVPLTAFAAEDDECAPWRGVREWRAYTTATFDARLFPGSHFFVTERTRDVVASVRRIIDACRISEGLS